MSDRIPSCPDPRAHRRPRPGSRRRSRVRPGLERLEGRALLSYGGGLDFTFGTQGTVSGSLGLAFDRTMSAASVLQPDGKLVVVGEEYSVAVGSVGSFDAGFNARRYNVDGSVDRSFGDQDLFSVGHLHAVYSEVGYVGPALSTGATAVALQADGKILVAGDVDDTALVARLNTDGSLDTTFGTAGVVTLGTAGKGDALLDYASAIAALPGGAIVVGGAVEPAAGQDSPAVEVLNADGAVDTGYGTAGLAVAPLPAAAVAYSPIVPVATTGQGGNTYSAPGLVEMAAEANGSVVLVANAGLAYGQSGGLGTVAGAVVTRLTPAGVPDASFGTAGQATVAPPAGFPAPKGLSASALAIQPDGSVVLGGSVIVPYSLPRMVVARLTPAGAPDPGFGIGGLNIPGGASPIYGSYAGAIAVQPDGKIVVADGFASDDTRLDPDGLIDPSFGTLGRSLVYTNTYGQDTPEAGAVGVSLAATGKILVARKDGSLTRLLGTGAPGDYDEDGVSDPAVYIDSDGLFAYEGSSGGGEVVPFGAAGVGNTVPVPGAYNGFGVTELAIYSPALAEYFIRPFYGVPYVAQPYGGPVEVEPFGIPGAGNTLPAPGDYDGSGKTELGGYLPNLGVFRYRPANGGPDVDIPFGVKGAGQTIPAPGDYFGTGQDDIAAYLPSLAAFEIRNPTNGQDVLIPIGSTGPSGDSDTLPMPGDYDGSGRTEVAVFLNGEFDYRPAGGSSEVDLDFGIGGSGTSIPAPGDYLGTGRTDLALYLTGPGVLAYRALGAPSGTYVPIGIPNQTIPFTLNPVMTAGGATLSIRSVPGPASAEIPLTPDLLDTLNGTIKPKKPATA